MSPDPITNPEPATTLPANPVSPGPARKNQWTKRRVIISVAVLGAAIGLIIAQLAITDALAHTSAPDIEGATISEASIATKNAGLAFAIDNDCDDDFPDDLCVVAAQSPEPNTRMERDTELTVDLAPVNVEVPDVTGMTFEEASKALAAVNLTAQVKSEGLLAMVTDDVDGAIADLKVSDQSVNGGTKLPALEVVELTVDVPSVEVPAVIGLTVAEATAALKEAGVGWAISSSEATPESPVIAQDPAGGETVDWASLVRVTPGVAIPSVVPSTIDGAKQRLKDAGLNPTTTVGSPSGAVTGTEPAAGTVVGFGTDVRIIQAEPQVVFSITSDGSEALITYATPGTISISQETAAALPWSKAFPDRSASPYGNGNISAQIQDGSWVECTITVNGNVVDRQRSEGQYSVVLCGG
jgi:serine/threonine-protein kinase